MIKIGFPWQVIIGLLPLIIVAVVIIIKRKKIIFPVTAILLCVSIAAVSFFVPEEKEKISLDESKISYLADINMYNGNYEEAWKYIEELTGKNGEDTQSTRLSFLNSLLQGDMVQASSRLKALEIMCENEEEKLTDFELGLLEELKSGKYDSMAKTTKEAAEGGLKQLESYIEEFKKDNDTAELLEEAVKIASQFNPSQMTEEDIKEQSSALYKIYKQDKDIFAIDMVEESLISGLVATKKFDRLIGYAQATGSEDAYVMLGNLLMDGTLEEKDFPEDFYDNKDYSGVVDKCKEIYSDLNSDDYSNAELSEIKNMVKAVETKNDNPVLVAVDEAVDPKEADSNVQSEMYLQNSVISSHLDDKDNAYTYIDSAMDTAKLSDNDGYKSAMESWKDIIDKKADNSEIKNMQSYVEQAFKESLPITDKENYSAPEPFVNNTNTYSNEKRAMINIGIINADDFPKIKAYISTGGTALDSKEDISVMDCGLPITEFDIEKVEYDEANVYLVCDNSGSMDSDIESLKIAVREFVDTQSRRENIGIITFEDFVGSSTELYSRKNRMELESTIESFHAGGGTNIGAGINEAIGKLDNAEAFNVIILMTDGQDNYGTYDSDEGLNELTKLCRDKNIIIYAIGLGDVNADYLERLAAAGNGSFIYSSDSVQLKELYTFLHNQIDNNYCLSFEAKDIVSNDRILDVSNEKQGYRDDRSYTLMLSAEEGEENEESGVLAENANGVLVGSLTPMTVYKSYERSAEFFISGRNFDKAQNITVTLVNDKRTVTIKTNVEKEKLTAELPEDIVYDTYTVRLVIDGTEYTYPNFNVLEAGRGDTIVFGAYTFKAQNIVQNGDTAVLSGNVSLNDYIRFKGNVTLNGDLNGVSITMSDDGGSYIACADGFKGLFKSLFTKYVTIPAFNSHTLYNDKEHMYDMEEYRVEEQKLSYNMFYGPFSFAKPGLKLNPDSVELSIADFSIDIPCLDTFLPDAEFKFNDIGASVLVNSRHFDFSTKFTYEAGDYSSHKLFGCPFKISKLSADINTLKDDYELEFAIALENFMPKLGKTENGRQDGEYGLNIAIKEGSFDKLMLKADFGIVICPEPPISLSDFMVGVEGLSGETSKGIKSRLAHATWEGGMDISVCKLADIIPALKGIFKDASLFTFDDTTVKVTPTPFSVAADTTFSLFGALDIGKAEVSIGSYKYMNPLLAINDDVKGFHIKSSNGISMNVNNNLNIEVEGSTGVDINNLFIGGLAEGKLVCKIHIFFVNFDSDLKGNLIMGIHGSDYSQFTMLAKGTDYEGGNETGFRLTFKKGDWLPSGELY